MRRLSAPGASAPSLAAAADYHRLRDGAAAHQPTLIQRFARQQVPQLPMLRALAANATAATTAMPAATMFPPLPHVPEPAIFDPSYAAKLDTVLSDTGFPPNTPPQKIYLTRLKVIEAILASRKESAHSISINLMVAFVSMALLCVFLLVRIRRNRQRALLGDTAAARKIVLPAFEPMLWLLGGLNVSLVVAFGTLLLTGDVGDYYFRVTIELAIAIKMLNGLLVVMYMLQPSLSVRALSAAFGKAFVLSMYTVPVVVVLNAVATRHNQRACYWTLLLSRLLVGIYLIRLATHPPTRASVLSIRLLCLYVVGMLLSLTWMNEAYHRGQAETARILGWAIAVYSAILPLSVWHVLRADTEHWRGIGKRAVELQDTFRRKSGRIEERVSSQGLHVLIEMHRKYIIDFARLQIYEPIPVTGNSDRNKAVVYRGFLHTKKTPVAIKVYMPTAFTEDVVAAFSHEAALCGALVHPNILKFHGLCVCPPNICLVTELCQASLYDVKHAQAAQIRRSLTPSRRRQQLLVDVGYMVDAARAIAYLHSFSPPFVHRDIQPSSFLVDDEGTVKLTDFGASRTLSVRDTSVQRNQRVHRTADMASTTETHTRTSLDGRAAVLEVSSRQHYVAPEVVHGRQVGSMYHGEAADIFSLAVTMWDVLHPGQAKFPRSQQLMSDAEIAERVAAGHRPALDPNIHVGLKELIEVMWHSDARMRPSAQTIVSSLEAIQEELCASFALEFMNGLHRTARLTSTGTMDAPKNFTGAQAVERMRLWDSVGSESEAIRLGNMLMDCGFVHHTKHARSFEYSSAQYMFDASQVLACQPLALLESDYESGAATRMEDEASHVHHHTERGDVVAKAVPIAMANQRRSVVSSVDEYATGRARSGSNGSSRALMEMRCACRKLGRRVETERSTQSRFRFKFKLFGDESQQLTAQLLADDQPSALSMGMGHFEELHEPVDLRGDRRAGKSTSGVVQIV